MPPRYRASLLILKFINDTPNVLLTDHSELPDVETDPHFWQTCEPLNDAASRDLGLQVVTLRCVSVDYDKNTSTVHDTYLMEYRSGEPTNGRWQRLELLPHSIHAVVIDAIEPSTDRAPWYRLGWSQMLDTLFPRASRQQVRSWERSTIWRIRSEGEEVYFKGVGRAFTYESRLTH